MRDYAKKQFLMETTHKVLKTFKKHPDKKLSEIVKIISESYHLTEDEETEIFTISSDILQKGEIRKTEIEFDINKTIPNSISFQSNEDLEKACKLLMKRSLGWQVKGDDSYPFLQFEDDISTKKALVLLRDQWNFIEKRKQTIGVISFDNYEDLEKVYEFMRKSGMYFESHENTKLQDIEASHIVIDDAYLAKDTKIEKIDQNKRYINVFKKR